MAKAGEKQLAISEKRNGVASISGENGLAWRRRRKRKLAYQPEMKWLNVAGGLESSESYGNIEEAVISAWRTAMGWREEKAGLLLSSIEMYGSYLWRGSTKKRNESVKRRLMWRIGGAVIEAASYLSWNWRILAWLSISSFNDICTLRARAALRLAPARCRAARCYANSKYQSAAEMKAKMWHQLWRNEKHLWKRRRNTAAIWKLMQWKPLKEATSMAESAIRPERKWMA